MRNLRTGLGWGTGLIVYGLLLLMRSAGVTSPTVAVWPWAVLAAGVGLLAHPPARRAGSLVTPLVLTVVGGVFALREVGALPGGVPVLALLLVIAGVVLLATSTGTVRGSVVPEAVTVPLNGSGRARLALAHGAGTLRVTGGASAGLLCEGTATGGVRSDVAHRSTGLDVTLRQKSPDIERLLRSQRPLDWNLALTDDVPMTLEVRTGASQVHLDLTGTSVDSLVVKTGASEVHVTLPAADCRVDIDAGAAEVEIRVPDSVAADIRVHTALAGVDVDQGRFPRDGERFRSTAFDTATHRAEIDLEGGVASFSVR